MSHANGEVILGDCVIGYFEYDGTADVAVGPYYGTRKEVHKAWRKQPNVRCLENHPRVGVFLYTDYAYGYFWPGEICPVCKTIEGGYFPWDEDLEYRIAEKIRMKYYCNPWPLDGHPLRVGIQDISYDWSYPCQAKL